MMAMNLGVLAAADREELRRGWLGITLLGALFTALGVAALVCVGLTTMLTVFFVGVSFLLAGLAGAIHAVVRRGWSGFWFELLAGVITALVGLFILLHPERGAGSLTAVLGAMFVIGGLFRLAVGLGTRNPYAGWFVLQGIVSAVLGVMILAEWPESAIWVLGTLVAVDLILDGLRLVTFGLAARRLTPETDDRPAGLAGGPSS